MCSGIGCLSKKEHFVNGVGSVARAAICTDATGGKQVPSRISTVCCMLWSAITVAGTE
jgi:hypothetical protein